MSSNSVQYSPQIRLYIYCNAQKFERLCKNSHDEENRLRWSTIYGTDRFAGGSGCNIQKSKCPSPLKSHSRTPFPWFIVITSFLQVLNTPKTEKKWRERQPCLSRNQSIRILQILVFFNYYLSENGPVDLWTFCAGCAYRDPSNPERVSISHTLHLHNGLPETARMVSV